MASLHLVRTATRLLPLVLVLLWVAPGSNAQSVQGSVSDAQGSPLVGVNVFIEGTTTGTATDLNGLFELVVSFDDGPQTLIFSFLGYERERRTLAAPTSDLHVRLREGLFRARELIVSASRMEERILEAPVSVQRLNAHHLQTMPSTEVISMLERYQGIDVSRSSLTMSSLSTRGFNSAKAERLIQLVDFVDFQAPSLSLYQGNMGGVDMIDIESIDVIYGANSALYGANAFNGVIIFNTKSPFDHPGISVRLKGGTSSFSPFQEYGDFAARAAHVVNDRLGVKLTGSYMSATDFIAQNYDVLTTIAGNIDGVNADGSFRFRGTADPRGYDAVNRYGAVDIGPALRAVQVAPGLTLGMMGLADQGAIFTPGFAEIDLIDPGYRAASGRLNAALYYRLTDDILAKYDFRYTSGNGLYQSSNRYVFDGIKTNIHSLSLAAPAWEARLYRSSDNAGDSFDMGFLGAFMNRQPYAIGATPTALEAGMHAAGALQGRNYAEAYAAVYGTAFAQARGAGASVADALAAAHAAASSVFPGRGEDRFLTARDATLGITTPGQSPGFEVDSEIYHAEGQVRHSTGGFDLALGGNYRAFQLSSNGTLFRDGPNSPIGTSPRDGIGNWELGSYLQVQRSVLENRLRLSGVGRADAFRNFDVRFSPRVSAVYSAGAEREHNFRSSFAQAYRAPAQLDQYIFLDIGPILLMGNIDNGFAGYDIAQTLAFFGGGAPPTLFEITPLQLEEVTSWEIGYRGLLLPRFYADVSYYVSRYNNFIGTRRFIGREDGTAPSLQEFGALQQGGGPQPGTPEFRNRSRVMQVWLNADQPVVTQGFQVGLEYRLDRALSLLTNYTWSHIEEIEDLILGFNTPRHKFNVGVAGEPLTNLGYNANLRWSDGYDFHMPFAEGFIESFYTLDAQVTYHLPRFNTRAAIGGTNLLDQNNVSAYGAAPIGRMIYTSLTFSR
jgi:iron complex outermembrane recepter protein